MMIVPHSDLVSEDLWAMFLVRCACCSAVSFLVWEWLLTLPFEVSTIWNSATAFSIRILYCTSRYLGLLAVIADSVLAARIHAEYTIDPKVCRWWFGFQNLTALVLLFGLELLLTMRVLALYGNGKCMAIFLCGQLAAKTLILVILAMLTVHYYGFGSLCLANTVPATAIYICALQLLSQAMIWWLTLLRHWQFVHHHSRSSSRLLHLVTRDGSWVFALLTAIAVAVLITSISGFYGGPFKTRAKYVQLFFPLLDAALSFSTCRIIKNMQDFVVSEEHHPGGDSNDHITTLLLTST